MANVTTKKDITNRFKNVIRVGYCNLQNLIPDECRDYDYYGKESWTRIHIIDNVAITTGYQPFGNINPDYDMCRKYEKLAMSIYIKYCTNYSQWNKIRRKLLKRFVREVLRLANKPKAVKLEYDLRQVDAWIDCCSDDEYSKPSWYYNESWHLDNVFVSENANIKQAFLRALKKHGIVCKKGACYIDSDGSVYELKQRKDDEPLFAFVPMF